MKSSIRAYLDAGFLLALLVNSSNGSPVATRLVSDLEGPFRLNFLHQLQVENFFVSLQTSDNVERQTVGAEGFRLWRRYLAEGVFQLNSADWDSAFRCAITWNGQSAKSAPFLLLLHPALAFVEGVSHFLSFDPRSRAVAESVGLKLLPRSI